MIRTKREGGKRSRNPGRGSCRVGCLAPHLVSLVGMLTDRCSGATGFVRDRLATSDSFPRGIGYLAARAGLGMLSPYPLAPSAAIPFIQSSRSLGLGLDFSLTAHQQWSDDRKRLLSLFGNMVHAAASCALGCCATRSRSNRP